MNWFILKSWFWVVLSFWDLRWAAVSVNMGWDLCISPLGVSIVLGVPENGWLNNGKSHEREWELGVSLILGNLQGARTSGSMSIALKWGFPKMGVPPKGWFIRENPIKRWMIWGTPILGNLQLSKPPAFYGNWSCERWVEDGLADQSLHRS